MLKLCLVKYKEDSFPIDSCRPRSGSLVNAGCVDWLHQKRATTRVRGVNFAHWQMRLGEPSFKDARRQTKFHTDRHLLAWLRVTVQDFQHVWSLLGINELFISTSAISKLLHLYGVSLYRTIMYAANNQTRIRSLQHQQSFKWAYISSTSSLSSTTTDGEFRLSRLLRSILLLQELPSATGTLYITTVCLPGNKWILWRREEREIIGQWSRYFLLLHVIEL